MCSLYELNPQQRFSWMEKKIRLLEEASFSLLVNCVTLSRCQDGVKAIPKGLKS